MARQLTALGFDAAALLGGYNAWRARYPVEPKQSLREPEQEAVPPAARRV